MKEKQKAPGKKKEEEFTLAPVMHGPNERVTQLCLFYLKTSCPG